jgi:hypothetical protein
VDCQCVSNCPRWDFDSLNGAADWTHCDLDPHFAAENGRLCTAADWDGDDNCTDGPYVDRLDFGDSVDITCSDGDGVTAGDLTEAQFDACLAILQAVISANGLCCNCNNNVCTCE